MPRKIRIMDAGFYHMISRGVERRIVFEDESCYKTFLEYLMTISLEYKVIVHSFCLMPNHYHLLIETTQENLSDFARKLNSSYASWFNQRMNRTGHLWQGRYLSYFIKDEAHFWTVCKYIERNPIAASLVQTLEAYPYQSFALRNHETNPFYALISASKIHAMPLSEYHSFLSTKLSKELFTSIYKVERINRNTNDKKYLSQPLSTFFELSIRNIAIKEAYRYGYTQTAIANYLDVSKMTISRILKEL